MSHAEARLKVARMNSIVRLQELGATIGETSAATLLRASSAYSEATVGDRKGYLDCFTADALVNDI